MANTVKVESWVFRINPNNAKELQRGSGQNFSHCCSVPNGEIYDLSVSGRDIILETSVGRYRRKWSGTIEKM